MRKNKTSQTVTWPTSNYFTIVELQKLNSKFINITLRVRLANEIESGKIAEIGSIPGGKGRPQKVFSKTPITEIVLNKAKSCGITLVDNAIKLVKVVTITSPSPTQYSTQPAKTFSNV
jgi:hypothetical protein